MYLNVVMKAKVPVLTQILQAKVAKLNRVVIVLIHKQVWKRNVACITVMPKDINQLIWVRNKSFIR